MLQACPHSMRKICFLTKARVFRRTSWADWLGEVGWVGLGKTKKWICVLHAYPHRAQMVYV